MRHLLLLSVCALAACTPQPANQANETIVNTVDTGDAPGPVTNDAPLTPPPPGESGGLDNDTTPVSEAAFTPESAQGGANVVQTYFTLLEAGKYRDAYLLWGNGGRDSGMDLPDFTASFAKYSEYHANIGAPGDIDAGAGQRHVTVPVQVYGRLREGNRAFNLRGTVTLHRTEVDGASPDQRAWRLRASDLRTRPGNAGAQGPGDPGMVDNRSTARYRCVDGTTLTARFDPDNRSVAVSRAGKPLATMTQQRVASGISYAGRGYALRAKGNDMTFTAPGLPPTPCTVIR